MNFIALAIAILISSVKANDIAISKTAIVRDEHFKAKKEKVILKDLISTESYDGKYFKIVKAKQDEAISFNDTSELQLKAATVYYHLTKARSYFSLKLGSRYVDTLPKIIIRLDLTNVFNEVGHFAHDNLDPQYNNALSIPGGIGYGPKKIKPWDMEIWFRPSKNINISDLSFNTQASLKGSLVAFRNQTHLMNLEQFINSILLGSISGTSSAGNIMRLVGSSVLIEAIFQSSDIAADFFSRKTYRLDAALVPEIIYHEFAHIALSEHLELSHSSAVNEGLADFFAGKIANSKKLATKIKDYNLFSGKAVRKKQQYRQIFEQTSYANTDFVFGLLWHIGEVVGEDLIESYIFNMSKKLNTNSTIREDLLEASLDTCQEMCRNSFNDRLKLYQLFHSKNL